jgi:hypothetical protein
MNFKTPHSNLIKTTVPIRVRGMSSRHKFFDETTETLYLSPGSFITRLRSHVDPDTEVHVTSNATGQSGSFRVLWINEVEHDGSYHFGMELLDVEGNIWGKSLEAAPDQAVLPAPEARIECNRCHTTQTIPLPEALAEFINDGFRMARHCEQCKGSTGWKFSPEVVEPDRVRSADGADDRRKGRASIKMKIKVYSDRGGLVGEDVCETLNVSANGLYFKTHQPYEVGEVLKIVAPFVESAVAIPIPARVVRFDRPADASHFAVAVEMRRA